MSNKKIPLLGNCERGLLFIVSAPAGTGKTTLVEMLTEEFPNVVRSVSYTTRKPRAAEIDGVDYYFITKKEFEEKAAAGEFLEHVELYNTCYGTSRGWVEDKRSQGKHVVLVIDTQGGLKLKGKVEGTFIFIQPPSLEVLRGRLLKRNTETEEVIAERLAWAKKEMDDAAFYDYKIINDDLNTAYQVLRSIFIAEEHRV